MMIFKMILPKTMEETMGRILGKVFFIALVFIFCAQSARAQWQHLQFGMKGGLNLASTNQSDLQIGGPIPIDFEKKVKPAFNVGAVIEYAFTKNLSLQFNPAYNVKGTKFQGTEVENFIGLIDFKVTEKFEYLSFPLLAKFRIESGQARPYLFLGPEPAYLLAAETIIEAKAMVGAKFDSTLNVKDDLQSLDLGLQGGIGIEFPVSSFNAFFEFSYSFGLIDINKVAGEENIKNRLIYINAGILF